MVMPLIKFNLLIKTLFIISVVSSFSFCDARSSFENFKLRKEIKLSNYITEADSLDLPTLDAYEPDDFSSLASPPPLNHDYGSLITPSPLIAQAPNIPGPSLTSPTPSPFGDTQISNPPEYAPNPSHIDPITPPNSRSPQPISPMPPVLRPAGAPRQVPGPSDSVWCVAKPTIPDPVLQMAMDYACGDGADCRQVKPNGSCFVPNTLVAHASYAFNSYWQRTKILGGTCDFGGTAMLITVDPSYHQCHFVYN